MIEIDCIHARPCGRDDAVDCDARVARRPHLSLCLSCGRRTPGQVVLLEADAPPPDLHAMVRQACFACATKCELGRMSPCRQLKALGRGERCPQGRW